MSIIKNGNMIAGSITKLFASIVVGMTTSWPKTVTLPTGFVEANGQLLNIVDYPELFGVFGIIHGGNGTTTFGTPTIASGNTNTRVIIKAVEFSKVISPYAWKLGANVASASSITPTGNIFHVTGTTTINTIVATPLADSKTIHIIPNGIFSTGTSGNIALASTAVVNKVLIMTYDASTAKWYPSY